MQPISLKYERLALKRIILNVSGITKSEQWSMNVDATETKDREQDIYVWEISFVIYCC